MEAEDELEVLDPVTIGDLIVLKGSLMNSYDGFLCASQAEMNVAMHVTSKQTNSRDSLEFDNYAFRVCPALNYRQSLEMQARSRVKPRTKAQKEAAESTLALLQQRVDHEVASNVKILESLAETGTISQNSSQKQLVRYGDFIMLQHVKSGCFLTAYESAAEKDAECRSLKVETIDSSLGLFRFLPKFKAHTEGSVVHYSHSMNIESVKQRGLFIHVSEVFMQDISEPNNPYLLKCLQTLPKLEANISPQSTAFTVTKYGRFTSKDVGLLRTGDPFRLYHSQTESFMHASCDAEKDRRYPQGRPDNFPSHIPYLKKLPDLGDTPDPTDPQHHYPKGVWCFEPRNRRSCAVVSWDAVYRLRHVPSGRYLAVDTTEPMHEETEGLPESWYGTCLVDDAALPGEEVAMFDEAGNHLGFKAVPSSWLEFVILSSELQTNEKIIYSELNIRIVHVYHTCNNLIHHNSSELLNNNLDPLNKKYLYLHCTEGRKPPKISNNNMKKGNHISSHWKSSLRKKSDNKLEISNATLPPPSSSTSPSSSSTSPSSGADKIMANQSILNSRKSKIIASSLTLVFSTVQSAQDIFKLLPTTKEENKITNHLFDYRYPLASYCQIISNSNFVITRDRITNIIKLLLSIIEFSIKGQFSFKKDENWILKANSMLPAAFSEIFSGDPNPLVQRISRDIKIMDLIFEVGFAPYIRFKEKLPKNNNIHYQNHQNLNLISSLTYVHTNPWQQHIDNNGSSQLSTEMEGPQAIQKLIHIVLQRLCNKNKENQDYFGKKSIVPIQCIEQTMQNKKKLNIKKMNQKNSFLQKEEENNQDKEDIHHHRNSNSSLSSIQSYNYEKEKEEEQIHQNESNESNKMEVKDASYFITRPWMSIILHHLQDPMGAAVTLSKLLSENEQLLKKYASKELVSRFVDLIKDLGPQPRLINFFEAICTINNVAIKANQEMVLRLTWIDNKFRKKIFLETNQFSYEILLKSKKNIKFKNYKSVKQPNGKLCKSWLNHHKLNHFFSSHNKFPSVYIGKDEFEHKKSFSPVFVRWDCLGNWKPGIDSLYYSPYYLNINIIEINKEEWVRLEDLCWVLEPERLCEVITGIKYHKKLKNDDQNNEMKLKKQTQLAQYYAGQLSMLSRLCYGRSYNCIAWIERSFPYVTLCSICYNIHLPAKIRGAATELLRNLYLNRYPQLFNLGRANFPEQLWVYELSKSDKNTEVNLVKNKKILDQDAFPCFCLLPSHKYSRNPDPFLGFPGQTKFFILRHLGNLYLKSYGEGNINHSNKSENEFLNVIVTLIESLTNFGFQSSYEKIKDLLEGLVRILDGRSDYDSVVMPSSSPPDDDEEDEDNDNDDDDDDDESDSDDDDKTVNQIEESHEDDNVGSLVPFQPLENRFKISPQTSTVTDLKSKIISILLNVMDLIANYRLGKLLYIFKHYREDYKLMNELKKYHLLYLNQEEDQYEGELVKKLYQDFEELFDQGDGPLLTLPKLSGGQEVDLILVDCLMYEDDKLFAKSLELLERNYAQRRNMITAIKDVVLLPNELIPIFGTSADMSAEISFLTFLIRSSEVWGVCSHTSGPFGLDKYKHVKQLCVKMSVFLAGKSSFIKKGLADSPNPSKLSGRVNQKTKQNQDEQWMRSEEGDEDCIPQRQNILRSLNFQTTLIDALEIDYNASFKGSICTAEEKIKSRELLVSTQRKLIQLLVKFVKGNTKNQLIVFKHLTALRRHLGPLIFPATWPDDFSDHHKELITVDPGMNTELVIIECLRNNYPLCQDEVPRDLLEEFGILVDIAKDPTACIHLDFLSVVCMPHGSSAKTIPRNQEMVIDVLLSDQLKSVQKIISDLFFLEQDSLHHHEKLVSPYRFIDLLAACIRDGNIQNAAKLQARHITIETTIEVLQRIHTKVNFSEVYQGKNQFYKLNPNNIATPLTKKEIATASSSNTSLRSMTSPTNRRSQSLGRNISSPHQHQQQNETISRNSISTDRGSRSSTRSLSPKKQSSLNKNKKTKKEIEKENKFNSIKTNYIDSMIYNDDYRNIGMFYNSLFHFFLLQLEVLVIDPKLFRMKKTWHLLTIGIKNIFKATRQAIIEYDLCSLLCVVATKACKIAELFIHSVRGLGLKEAEKAYEKVIISDDYSIYNSAYILATTSIFPSSTMNDNDDDVNHDKDGEKSIKTTKKGEEMKKDRDSLSTSRHSISSVSSNVIDSIFNDAATDALHPSSTTLQDEHGNEFVDPLGYPLKKEDFKLLQCAAVKLCNVLDPTQLLHNKYEEEYDDEDDGGDEYEEEEDENDDDEDVESEELKRECEDKNQQKIKRKKKKKSEEDNKQKKNKKKQQGGFLGFGAKEIHEVEEPNEVLGYFSKALENNPNVKKKLKSRQFSLVEVLENSEHTTGHNGAQDNVGGADGIGSTEITWSMLVGRMVNYVIDHNHDTKNDTCIRVMRVLRSHLVKARSDQEGNYIGIWDLSDSERQDYIDKQSSFVGLGVTRIALKAIATHPCNVEGNLADEGVEMLIEMTFGGNVFVQTEVVNFITNYDRDNKLAHHLEGRIKNALEFILERKSITMSKFVHISDEHEAAYLDMIQTFNFFQQLCEGHNLQAQNILREQPGHMVSVNLINSSANVLSLLAQSSTSLTQMSEVEILLVIATLDLLTESTLGPCSGNQTMLVANEDLLAGVDKILQSNFDKRIRIEYQLQCKYAAVFFLVSLIEGRSDNLFVHHILTKVYGPELFKFLRESIMQYLKNYEEIIKKKKYSKLFTNNLSEIKRALLNMSSDDKIMHYSLEIMSAISTLILELSLVQEFAERVPGVFSATKQPDLLDEEVVVIEIKWGDRLERSSFPLPKDAPLLTEKTKQEFYLSADLSTNDKRMKQLLTMGPVFMTEMEQIDRLRKSSAIYSFINDNIISIKWSMYALVVLLNLNIVMASYGQGSPDGYVSISDGLFYGNVEKKYLSSLYISLILAVLNLFGYIVIVLFLATTEVPITIASIDDLVSESEDNINMKESEYRNSGAFTWWFVTLVFNIVFIIQHRANYPDKIDLGLYYFLVFGINLPWTISCVRNYIVVPNTPLTRYFCVTYDVLVGKPFFRNHVLLMVCSINGFGASYYFPLMLMDIVNNSQVIADIAKNLTDNIVALSWVFYLFIVTIIIYAQFGLEYFEDYFVYSDDDDTPGCHSVVSCAWLIFYKGIPNGSLDGVLDVINNRDPPTYIERVLFDLTFFVWVGVLLFNIVTGLMVDGFGALREENNERSDILDNSCFVCGFTRDAYDEIPDFKGPNFDHHIGQEHFLWNYLYFYIYLKRKDKTSYSGVESYVWSKMAANDISWIPVRNSLAIQESQAELPSEISDENKEKMFRDQIVKQVLKSVRETFEELSHKQQNSFDEVHLNTLVRSQSLKLGARYGSINSAHITTRKESELIQDNEKDDVNVVVDDDDKTNTQNKKFEKNHTTGEVEEEVEVSVSMFLSWIHLENAESDMAEMGFTDLDAFDDVQDMSSDTLSEYFKISESEAERLKALVSLKIFNFEALHKGFMNTSYKTPNVNHPSKIQSNLSHSDSENEDNNSTQTTNSIKKNLSVGFEGSQNSDQSLNDVEKEEQKDDINDRDEEKQNKSIESDDKNEHKDYDDNDNDDNHEPILSPNYNHFSLVDQEKPIKSKPILSSHQKIKRSKSGSQREDEQTAPSSPSSSPFSTNQNKKSTPLPPSPPPPSIVSPSSNLHDDDFKTDEENDEPGSGTLNEDDLNFPTSPKLPPPPVSAMPESEPTKSTINVSPMVSPAVSPSSSKSRPSPWKGSNQRLVSDKDEPMIENEDIEDEEGEVNPPDIIDDDEDIDASLKVRSKSKSPIKDFRKGGARSLSPSRPTRSLSPNRRATGPPGSMAGGRGGRGTGGRSFIPSEKGKRERHFGPTTRASTKGPPKRPPPGPRTSKSLSRPTTSTPSSSTNNSSIRKKNSLKSLNKNKTTNSSFSSLGGLSDDVDAAPTELNEDDIFGLQPQDSVEERDSD